jgi:hypothetical protein
MSRGRSERRANVHAAICAFAVLAAAVFLVWQAFKDEDLVRDSCEERIANETAIPEDSPSHREWIKDCVAEPRGLDFDS